MDFSELFVVSKTPVNINDWDTDFRITDFKTTDPNYYLPNVGQDREYLLEFVNRVTRPFSHFLNLRDFMDFHFKGTPDKEKFLIAIEYRILPMMREVNSPSQTRISIVEDWLKQEKERQNTPSVKPVELQKIVWNGTQKELAELFIQLKEKGWIEGFEYDTIKSCFTNAHSIHQYLKPFTENKTYEPTFEKVYTKEYKPMFFAIKPNTKKHN